MPNSSAVTWLVVMTRFLETKEQIHSWPNPGMQETGSDVMDGAGFVPEFSALLQGVSRGALILLPSLFCMKCQICFAQGFLKRILPFFLVFCFFPHPLQCLKLFVFLREDLQQDE